MAYPKDHLKLPAGLQGRELSRWSRLRRWIEPFKGKGESQKDLWGRRVIYCVRVHSDCEKFTLYLVQRCGGRMLCEAGSPLLTGVVRKLHSNELKRRFDELQCRKGFKAKAKMMGREPEREDLQRGFRMFLVHINHTGITSS